MLKQKLGILSSIRDQKRKSRETKKVVKQGRLGNHSFLTVPLFPCFFVLWFPIKIKIPSFCFYLFVYFCVKQLWPLKLPHYKKEWCQAFLHLNAHPDNQLCFICSYACLLHSITDMQETSLHESSCYGKCWQKARWKL